MYRKTCRRIEIRGRCRERGRGREGWVRKGEGWVGGRVRGRGRRR
jgi:hypothetical protein